MGGRNGDGMTYSTKRWGDGREWGEGAKAIRGKEKTRTENLLSKNVDVP